MDAAKEGVTDILKEMILHVNQKIEENKQADFSARTAQIVDYLKEQAENSSYKITKGAARERAIKLLEGVGISDPRRRVRHR